MSSLYRTRVDVGRGFTLIELLVVVSVIGLLIGVLLPALASARDSSVRVSSMNNQRQLGLSIQLYANDFDDRAPLGYSLGPGEGWKQYNYLLRTNPSSGGASLRWMGLLYEHGAFETPMAFYSPAEQDPLMQFDTADNPWPPDETAPAGKSTRIGFGVRPMIGWPFPSTRAQPEGMPRLSGLRSTTAIVADLLHKPERLALRHGDGVHVTYADGSIDWVQRAVLDAVEVDGVRWADTDDTGFDVRFNSLFLSQDPETGADRGIWAELDR